MSPGLALFLQKHIKKGDYLWELISPRDKEGLPARSPTGRYKVKLFIMVGRVLELQPAKVSCRHLAGPPDQQKLAQGPLFAEAADQSNSYTVLQDTWRAVTIDDRIPVDLFGEQISITGAWSGASTSPLAAHTRAAAVVAAAKGFGCIAQLDYAWQSTPHFAFLSARLKPWALLKKCCVHCIPCFVYRPCPACRQPSAAAVAIAVMQGHPEGYGCIQKLGQDTATSGVYETRAHLGQCFISCLHFTLPHASRESAMR